MKLLLSFSTLLLMLFLSCENKEDNHNPGTIEFSFNFPETKLKSLSQPDSTGLAFVLITIKDKDDNFIYNNEEIVIYKMGDYFITKPISLDPGEYKLTGFLVSNSSKAITYATPNQNSKLSYLVTKPLPIKFNVLGDQVIKLAPEVISTVNINPLEFGYSTFSMNVVKTFNIYVSAFKYNNVIKNYELTDAWLKVTFQNDTSKLNLALSDSTNNILLPEKQTNYTVTASKNGYNPITFSFSLDSLKSFQSKPLMFVFSESSNLVAHFPFNGNVLDYSGYNNHGRLFGALPTKDRFDNTSKAYVFDGSDDYVRVANSPSLNPTNAITVAAWYKTTPFVGSGNDGLVNKGFSSHIDPYYQYQLGVAGSNYWNAHSGFGFSITLNDVYKAVSTESNFYELYKWYHIVGTYDGSTIKLFVNGILVDSEAATGTMKNYGSDLFIGRLGNRSDYYNTTFHLPGSIDDVRIYNKALSTDEILTLYKNL